VLVKTPDRAITSALITETTTGAPFEVTRV